MVQFLQDVFFNNPEVFRVEFEAHVTVKEWGDGFLKIRQEIWSKLLYPGIFQKHTICDIVEDPRSKSNLVKRNKWIILFIRVLALEFNIINDYKALLNNKAEQIQKFFILPYLLHYWFFVMHFLVVERLHCIRLADIREKNLENVWSVEDLAFDLGFLLHVELF